MVWDSERGSWEAMVGGSDQWILGECWQRLNFPYSFEGPWVNGSIDECLHVLMDSSPSRRRMNEVLRVDFG